MSLEEGDAAEAAAGRQMSTYSYGGGGGDGGGKRGGDQAGGGEGEQVEEMIRIHVTALDEVVSVNSFFTVAIFIGLSLSNDKSLVAKGPGDPCLASTHMLRQLVLLEVLSFGCFLMSSLVAQGLKLHLTICSVLKGPKKGDASCCSSTSSGLVVACHPRALRLGVLATAFGSVGGTVFLMLSMVIIIQLRLGMLTCPSIWSKMAVIPLLLLVSSGVTVFISAVLMAFRR